LDQISRLGICFCTLISFAIITGCGGAGSNFTTSGGSTAPTPTPTPTPAPTPTPTPSPTPTPVTATTTLDAETSTNTSVATTYPQTTGNEAPANVSKVDTRTLLYPGATTKIYAHFMAWFGDPKRPHLNIGYTSSDPNQVNRQVTDAMSRGISGFIEDWYGQNNTMPNDTAFVLKKEAESRNGGFQFAIMEDGGALNTCAATSGCDLTGQMIIDLTYAYDNFETSPAYMKISGRPAVFFFDPDRFGTLDWQLVMNSVPGNPVLVFQNSGGFTHAQSGGSISWVQINKTDKNDWSQSYLDDFYAAGRANPQGHAFGATYKGFNDTLASWSEQRIVNQNCGQTWLSTFSEIGKYYSAATQLESLQLVTWNDYEESTEIETGIDNCVSVSPSVAANQLSWTISGNENTVDHYTPFISIDGVNLMALSDVPAGVHSVDLSSYRFAAGSYSVFVKAVGKASMKNHISSAVAYTSTGA
jgi:hypothetical protein